MPGSQASLPARLVFFLGRVAAGCPPGQEVAMFLDCYGEKGEVHELDFRFEVREDGREFLFANHGLNLGDLAQTLDLADFGSSFYLVDFGQPVSLEALIADRERFEQLYQVRPTGFCDRYLFFDLATATRFLRNSRADDWLDCVILGVHDSRMASGEFERILNEMLAAIDQSRPAFTWEGSWLGTHDNHFFWILGRSQGLLRRLIAESLLGFFHHIEPRCRAPVPGSLVDLLLSEYHKAPIVCFPTEWVEGREVPVGVQREEDRISALLETAESSWIAHQVHPPPHLVGRALHVTFDLQEQSWSFERWA